MIAIFQEPVFQDEDAARQALEALRWPDGPYCPHCGCANQHKIAKVEGTKKSHRPGLYYCNDCKGQFTVTVGTVFERSKVPLTKWWAAAHMMNSSKNGVSAHEIHRNLGVTYKTAWFMMHRLREAMIDAAPSPMGSSGGAVQADKTYHLNTSKRAKSHKSGFKAKAQIVALVDEDTKIARTFHVEKGVNVAKIQDILFQNVRRKEFRYNNRSGLGIITDGERTMCALKGIEGKRLTYRSALTKIVNKRQAAKLLSGLA